MSASPAPTHPAPETRTVHSRRFSCDGGEGALGHPRVWLEIDEKGYVECGYCDRRFVAIGGPADGGGVPAETDTGAAA